MMDFNSECFLKRSGSCQPVVLHCNTPSRQTPNIDFDIIKASLIGGSIISVPPMLRFLTHVYILKVTCETETCPAIEGSS